jgi:hypothetical protein
VRALHNLPKGESAAYDKYTGELEYKAGEIIHPDKFDDDIRVECANGIHFFITRREAEEY